MKITILIDNTPDEKGLLMAEHGLSMYLETGGKRILVDTGRSSGFTGNAEKMGIDLNRTDFCFLSHGHNDHTGGLGALLERTEVAPIWVSERIFAERYYSSRHEGKRNLSTDEELLREYEGRFRRIADSRWIAQDCAAVFCHEKRSATPIGNVFLTKEVGGTELPDDFAHEMALAVRTEQGLVVISSCSHCGAMNIMRACEDFCGVKGVAYFIGGLHFVDCNKTSAEIECFSQEAKEQFPDTQFITGHCTSDKAKELLKKEGMKMSFFRTGSRILVK